MNSPPLPRELADLEARLRARPEPAAGALRGRVVAAVAGELMSADAPPRWNWRFAAAAAAVLLVGMNLAMAAARATEFVRRPGPGPARLAAVEAQVRQVVPEASATETRPITIALLAREQLAGSAAVRSPVAR